MKIQYSTPESLEIYQNYPFVITPAKFLFPAVALQEELRAYIQKHDESKHVQVQKTAQEYQSLLAQIEAASGAEIATLDLTESLLSIDGSLFWGLLSRMMMERAFLTVHCSQCRQEYSSVQCCDTPWHYLDTVGDAITCPAQHYLYAHEALTFFPTAWAGE